MHDKFEAVNFTSRNTVRINIRTKMSEQDEDMSNKEKRILVAMRKTLSSIVRDVTPTSSSLKSPLSKSTTDDIIMCFGLITAREQEIDAQNKLLNSQKPHFTDEVKTTQTVSLDSLKATMNKSANKNNTQGDK
ncbi:MAG: hypothetical protein ACI88H_000254 [Cocleimonas sp.]|jgi:hypothetical protein